MLQKSEEVDEKFSIVRPENMRWKGSFSKKVDGIE